MIVFSALLNNVNTQLDYVAITDEFLQPFLIEKTPHKMDSDYLWGSIWIDLGLTYV